MDTINIINNFDQKILMGNILVLNQKKLLDGMIEMFETNKTEFSNKSIQEIIEFIDTQKIINWELFVELINLDTNFFYHGHMTNSLCYLVERKSIMLLSFLLKLDKGVIRWNMRLTNSKSNILHFIFKKLYWEEDLLSQIFNSTHFTNTDLQTNVQTNVQTNMYEQPDVNLHTPMYWIVTKSNEIVIMEAISLGLISLDWVDLNSNGLVHWACKRNFLNLFDYLLVNKVNLEQDNIQLRRPIHLACIKNNYQMVKSLVENNVQLERYDKEIKKPINYAIKYGDFKLVQLLLDKQVEMENNIIYDVIEYQNSQTIDCFLSDTPIDLSESNFIWVASKLMLRKLFTQTLSYSIIKINGWIQNYMYEQYTDNIYIEGRCFS
jgi:hypothetical protein